MAQAERKFDIEVKSNGAVVVYETAIEPVAVIPPVAGGSIEADIDLSTRGKVKRYQAVQDTLKVIADADLHADSVEFSRGSKFVIKK